MNPRENIIEKRTAKQELSFRGTRNDFDFIDDHVYWGINYWHIVQRFSHCGLVELVQRDLLPRMDLPDMIVDRVRPFADVATIRALITRQRITLVSVMPVHRVALREGLLAFRTVIPQAVRPDRALLRLTQVLLNSLLMRSSRHRLRSLCLVPQPVVPQFWNQCHLALIIIRDDNRWHATTTAKRLRAWSKETNGVPFVKKKKTLCEINPNCVTQTRIAIILLSNAAVGSRSVNPRFTNILGVRMI